MRNYFRLPANVLLDKNLTAPEFSVLAYLLSVHSKIKSRNNAEYKRVRQATIAHNCGIKTAQTVSRITASLAKKGYISAILKGYRNDRLTGTYTYVVNNSIFSWGSYALVSRETFGKLSPVQLRVYCFMLLAEDRKLGYSWNSYNDIAEAIHVCRNTAINAVGQLVQLGMVNRVRRRRRDNERVYADNCYAVIVVSRVAKSSIKKEAGLCTAPLPINITLHIRLHSRYVNVICVYIITSEHICQSCGAKKLRFFVIRGSPRIEALNINQSFYNEKRRIFWLYLRI